MKWLVATVAGLTIAAAGVAAVMTVDMSSTPDKQKSPVQTDVARLAKLCPGLSGARSAHWRFWELGTAAWYVPGPTDYAIEALVTLPAPEAAALRQSVKWEASAPPSASGQLTPHLPSGEWSRGRPVVCDGYSGAVFLLEGTTVVYLNLRTM